MDLSESPLGTDPRFEIANINAPGTVLHIQNGNTHAHKRTPAFPEKMYETSCLLGLPRVIDL
jgi:hypothetical protein